MHSTHWITRATLGWLALGIGALMLRPDALYNQTLGWSASWWLLVAPVLTLLLANRRIGSQAAPQASRWRSIRASNTRMMARYN